MDSAPATDDGKVLPEAEPRPATLVAEQDTLLESGGRQKKRRLTRRSTEDQADRCIAEHFKGWSKVQTTVVKVEGVTLRERIIQDKRRCKHENTRLSSGYWRDLQAKYAGEESPLRKLQVLDANEPVRPSLIEALKVAQTLNCTTRSKAALVNWFKTETSCNQKELCGLVRLCLQQRPNVSLSHCSVILGFAAYIDKWSLKEKFPSEIATLRGHIDEALCYMYASMKKEKIGIVKFWTCYRSEASLILDAGLIDKAVKATGLSTTTNHNHTQVYTCLLGIRTSTCDLQSEHLPFPRLLACHGQRGRAHRRRVHAGPEDVRVRNAAHHR